MDYPIARYCGLLVGAGTGLAVGRYTGRVNAAAIGCIGGAALGIGLGIDLAEILPSSKIVEILSGITAGAFGGYVSAHFEPYNGEFRLAQIYGGTVAGVTWVVLWIHVVGKNGIFASFETGILLSGMKGVFCGMYLGKTVAKCLFPKCKYFEIIAGISCGIYAGIDTHRVSIEYIKAICKYFCACRHQTFGFH